MTTPEPGTWHKYAEKVQLAVGSSLESHFERGTSGLELEFNILDASLKPVVSVGSGPESRSFADHLNEERLPEWARDRFQLEVFHWMTEATTRPYYSPTATVAESRLLEGTLLNALDELGLSEQTVIVFAGDNGPTAWPFYYEKRRDDRAAPEYAPGVG